jgi:hypothetical protein
MLALTLMIVATASIARADVVLDWNAIALRTTAGNPFTQARLMAITQLAVFEAVNAINGGYEPYLGTISAAPGASAEAAAIAAAHKVLVTYFATSPVVVAQLDADRAASLAAIPDGPAETAGIAAGEAAAAAMITNRAADGSSPPQFHLPGSTVPGEWQTTPSCPPAGGVFYQWGQVVPFGIPSTAPFIPPPPPAITSNQYLKDYNEVKAVGGTRTTDPADVPNFYGSISPGYLLGAAAAQLSAERGDSLSENAWALALLNMAINDSLIVSFATKYHYNFWRPETAIRSALTDGNPRTAEDTGFVPYITTPCFPSYPSNHASGTNGGLEILRRIYGAAGHSLTIVHPNPAAGTRQYTSLEQISDSVDYARIYGGIHFRFDQVAGNRIGREVATYVYKNNLRKITGSQ